MATKEHPILFSWPMVRALLEGRKTQTRRSVKTNASGRTQLAGRNWHLSDPEVIKACPYGTIGDRLWVRETWGRLFNGGDENEPIFYRADYSKEDLETQVLPGWKPSIHMPRSAARLFLEITDIRVERLHNISEYDCAAEGIEISLDGTTCAEFGIGQRLYRQIWESINGKESWNRNPHVWCVTFMVETK